MTEQKIAVDLDCTFEEAMAAIRLLSDMGYNVLVKRVAGRFAITAAREAPPQQTELVITRDDLIDLVAVNFGISHEQVTAALQSFSTVPPEARH